MRHNSHSAPENPHRLTVDDLCERLACSVEGLTPEDARDRLAFEGPNSLTETQRASFIVRFGKHLVERFALLLWAGSILALIGEQFSPGEGMILISGALACTVFINASFSYWQEVSVERAIAALRGMLSPHAKVRRDGAELEIDAADVVMGDVIVLREGDRIAADARLIEANGLKVDNAPLTGESEPQLRTTAIAAVSRLDARNLVFSGTMVTTGTGAAIVYATGNHTEIGKIAGVMRETERVETPIRRELRFFVRTITIIALVLGAAFFVTGFTIGNPFWTNLLFAIGIIVANVPEGLLPTVTLALAIACRKMAKRNALLKSLESAETLGSTTVICTDKTGTLTQNDMRVVGLFLGAQARVAENHSPGVELALQVMALCNNATCQMLEGKQRIAGDPTETALLYYAEDATKGIVEKLRNDHPRVHEHPFDSGTKEMATVHEMPEGPVAFLKGAPEVIIDRCSEVLRDGHSTARTDDDVNEFRRIADQHAREGKRVLALARKPVGQGSDFEEAVSDGGYVLIGLVAMQDPPRPEAADAVARCREAGMRLVVISGDHPLTVEAVSRQVGIVTSEKPAIYTGDQLARWSRAKLRHALRAEEVVFARTSPMDKLRIVASLQHAGHVVAVTGDGVNDAPALKRADVGIAMGMTGTDVAREAADVVLLDDNFSTIVAAVEEGRVIFANIRRFIGYVLSSNIPEILPYIAFVLFDIPLPMPVMLILAIDLGTDLAPAIGLAAEPAEIDVMKEPPRPRTERLLNRRVLTTAYLLYGPFEAAAGFAGYFWVLLEGGWKPGMELAADDPLYAQSIAGFFTAVVICQISNLMVWRSTYQSIFSKGFLRNRAVLFGIGVELLLVFGIVETPIGHAVFGTASISSFYWLLPIPFAFAMLVIAEIIRFGLRSRREKAREAAPAAAV